MKNYLLLLLFVTTFSKVSFSQKIIKENTLFSVDKKLGLISKYGLRSVIKGIGPNNNSNLTPALEITNIDDNGFLLRNEYSFTKYNDNLEQEWETKIEKIYGLQCLPQSYTIGNNKGIYFIQISNNPLNFNQLHITRFDNNGKSIETRFNTNKLYDGVSAYFINNDGLFVIMYKILKDEQKINYFLLRFSQKDLSTNIKDINLEYDEYEGSNVSYEKKEFIWKYLTKKGNKIILFKKYIKKNKGAENNEFIIKTIEINFNGEISNLKKIDLKPLTSSFDKSYYTPTIEFDTIHDEIYLIGVFNIKRDKHTSGLYLYKYNYTENTPIFKKEYEYDNLSSIIPDNSLVEKTCKAIKLNSITFDNNTKLLDMEKQELRLYLFYQLNGRYQNKMLGLRFSKNGDLNYIDNFNYSTYLSYFDPQYLVPKEYNFYWKSSDYYYKSSPFDFITSLTGKMDSKFVICNIFTKKDFNIVTYTNDKKGEIKAFKLEK